MKTKPVDEKDDELNLIKLAREYSDEDKARELFESMRWPNGPCVRIAAPIKASARTFTKSPRPQKA